MVMAVPYMITFNNEDCSVLFVGLAKRLHTACAEQLTICSVLGQADCSKQDRGSSHIIYSKSLEKWAVSSGMCVCIFLSTGVLCRLAGLFVKPSFYEPLVALQDPLPGLHANTHLAQASCP